MKIIPHLQFNGQCEAAFHLYAECLRGEITLMLRYSDVPTAASELSMTQKIAHATLKVGDQTITGADLAGEQYERPRGFAMQMNFADVEHAWRVFDTLSAQGEVLMPLGKTFWSEMYAVFTDRFGVPWEINLVEPELA